MDPSAAHSQEVFLGRQPILDRNQVAIGYELLFRRAADNRAEVACARAATADVVCKAFAELGLSNALGSQKAFINVDEAFLCDDAIGLLPAQSVVLEVEPGHAPSPRLVGCARELRARGYDICVSGLGGLPEGIRPLLELAAYVKVDLDGTPPPALQALAATLRKGQARLIAGKVESAEDLRRCADLGFHFFQGYYFARPVVVEGRKLDSSTQGLIRLINLLDGDAELAEIEAAFKGEPALLVNLLRLTNSVGVGLSARIASVRHAVAVLGQRQLLRWLQLLLFSRPGARGGIAGNPLLQLAALRARLLELLCVRCHPARAELHDLAFITGLMSLMPAALGLPMTEILAQIAVAPEARRALSRHEGELGLLLELIERYDDNDMGATAAVLARLGGPLSFQSLGQGLAEAIAWVQQLSVDAQ